MNDILDKKRRVGYIPVCILCLLIIITETPILARNIPNAVYYGLVMLFYLFSVNFILRIEKRKIAVFVFLIFYLIILAAYKFLKVSTADLSYYSTTCKFLFFLTAMLLIGDALDRKQRILLIAVVLLSMSVTMLDNFRLFYIYGPSRFVHLFQTDRFTTNSVNTAFVGSQLLFSGVLFVYFLHSKKMMRKIIALILALINIYFAVAIAQRMVVLLLAVIMFPLLILYNSRTNTKRIVLVMLAIVVLLVLMINIESVLKIMDKIIGSDRMSIRFNQLLAYFSGGNIEAAGGSFSAHYKLIMQSIKTWFSSAVHFFLGAGDHRAHNLIVGNHSEFFDECARYGLIGIMIWLPMTVLYFRQILSCSEVIKGSNLKRQLKVILFTFVLRSMVGSIYEASIAVQLFIMIPLVFSLMAEKESYITTI